MTARGIFGRARSTDACFDGPGDRDRWPVTRRRREHNDALERVLRAETPEERDRERARAWRSWTRPSRMPRRGAGRCDVSSGDETARVAREAMMRGYTVTLDGHELSRTTCIYVDDVDVGAAMAAEAAVEHWYESGEWAGEDMPSTVDVTVSDEAGVFRRMTVNVEWSPEFCALERREERAS